MTYGPFVEFFYGWAPAIFTLGSLAGSALISWRARKTGHFWLTGLIFMGTFACLFMLYDIFRLGGEASFRPHFLTAGIFCAFAGQAFLFFRRNTEEKTTFPD